MFSNDTDETGLFSNDNNKITINIKKKKSSPGNTSPRNNHCWHSHSSSCITLLWQYYICLYIMAKFSLSTPTGPWLPRIRVELPPAGWSQGTLHLGLWPWAKTQLAPVPIWGHLQADTKGSFFLPSCTKCVPDWEFFWVIRFNSIQKRSSEVSQESQI